MGALVELGGANIRVEISEDAGTWASHNVMDGDEDALTADATIGGWR